MFSLMFVFVLFCCVSQNLEFFQDDGEENIGGSARLPLVCTPRMVFATVSNIVHTRSSAQKVQKLKFKKNNNE